MTTNRLLWAALLTRLSTLSDMSQSSWHPPGSDCHSTIKFHLPHQLRVLWCKLVEVVSVASQGSHPPPVDKTHNIKGQVLLHLLLIEMSHLSHTQVASTETISNLPSGCYQIINVSYKISAPHCTLYLNC